MKKSSCGFLISIILMGLIASGVATAADITVIFENSVFIGDSITEGFAFNEILPREHVIAGAGTTAGFVYDDINGLAELSPENVFIMLGSIDILMPVDNPKKLFRDDLTKLVDKISKEVPDAKIYFQSITPVTQEAINREPRYQQIEEYNEILKELADNLSVNYVDIGELARNNPDLFAEDGIHFKKEFFQLWLNELSLIKTTER